MTDQNKPEAGESALNETPESTERGNEEPGSDAATEDAAQAASVETGEDESETEDQPRPPAKLERLQKILAQAGVASRRSAEELITQGRVQVNGKIVTELGTKADAARDHIRVDGKLLHGAERLRYFMLNKPRGFVTTVKDPEGRPTVMEFFAKMAERLYPVGRLDYLSEGLLLVTNDGELANKLTRAASGVEKTYLVKVSGQPTEDELETLRGGVSIERGKAGEGRVRTAPARIRQVRQGDNPWYEVVLIEGRNRELRKMFEEIGHFVEKIRRVGYGPLVLDVEPGKLRELAPEELAALRLAAEGKLRTPKAKEIRRRNAMDAQLPTLAPRPSQTRPARPAEGRSTAAGRTGDYRPPKSFGPPRSAGKPFRPTRPSGEEFRPAAGRSPERSADRGPARGPARPDERPRRAGAGPARFGPGKPTPGRPAERTGGRPAWKQDERPARPSERPAARPEWKKEPGQSRTFGARPAANKPAWNKPAGGDRPDYKRPAAPRGNAPASAGGFAGPKSPRLRIEAVEPERPGTGRPSSARSSYSRPSPARPRPDRPRFDRPKVDRPSSNRPSGPGRTGAGTSRPSRPFRSEGGLARPFTTSTGKPRAGGARPSSKPGRPAGSRPAGPAAKTGWKPKPQFGGPGKPASSGRSKPAFGSRPGGSAKSGYKGKPGGAKRTGPRPGGKRPGGAPGGRKQGRN
ncbi:MAG: pseudouridine synthase [Acidobacteriota bacterium]|nr:pseudouridine synthase [Acidobacteriota bacterium]